MDEMESKEQECCPVFQPEPWDDTMLHWDLKQFVREKVCTFFYMPMNFGQVMRKLMPSVAAAGAETKEWFCLSDHTSRWNMDLLLEVTKEVPGLENLKLSGMYFSKVYEGPFKLTGKWAKDFAQRVHEKGLRVGKTYMWYTTCPKCAKKYGKNYVVFIGEALGS